MNKTFVIGATLGVGLLAGCGATSGGSSNPNTSAQSPAATVDASAFATMVSNDASTLSTDLSTASAAMGADDLTSSATDLNTVAADVASFQNDLSVNPVPPQFKRSASTISTALGDYSTGCQDAENGIANMDAGSIATATTLFGQANALLTAAVSELGS